MKFKGTAKYQTKIIFEMSGMLCFGQSKHTAKQTAKSHGTRGPTEFAQATGVYSYSTYRAYFKTCTELMQYVSDVHGIKKADRLTSEHVRDFLLSKTGVKLATFRRYCAALTKFDSALSKLLDRQPQWNGILKDFRESAPVALESEQPARAYRQPLSLVAQIDDERMRLIAELQWQCGLRVSEACNIKSHQMKGITIDNTEKQTGMIEIKGKGGKVRQVPVSIEIYTNLQNRLDHGPWAVDPAAYRVSLRQAAHRSGQEYARHGTHGLRWNYAQSLMDNLIRENVAYEVALTQISKLLGHERAGITCLYLRKG